MDDEVERPPSDGVSKPTVIRQYKRTISDLLPDKYELSPDTHLYIASSLPPDNQWSTAETVNTTESEKDDCQQPEAASVAGRKSADYSIQAVYPEPDAPLGPTSKAMTASKTSNAADSLTQIEKPLTDSALLPPPEGQTYDLAINAINDSVASEDDPYSLPVPAVATQPASPAAAVDIQIKPDEPLSVAVASQPPSLEASAAEDYSLPTPRSARRITGQSDHVVTAAEDNNLARDDTDATQNMLLQALSDLQADNAALTKALSAQSQEIKALRDSADQNTFKQDSAPEQEEESELEAAQEDTAGEAAQETAAVEDAAREEAPPKDRTEARYRSLELKVQRLKAERDQMEKALRREVGDDTPLTKLLEGDSSDWRGRAQQIALLKERLLSLHEAHAQAMGTPSNARNRHDVSNRAHLERLRGERMKEAEDLRAELASTRAALEEAVSRQQGAAARKKALEKEVRSLKAKVGLLLDKSATDDSLIAALRSPAARSGAYATSQQAMQLPNQAMANQAWETGSPAAFPAAGGALTGPVVTWEGPERGVPRVSVVVPGGPAPDQAADRGDQLAAAESASAQRTSFSISLDINTNVVSIQGSVTSPNLADRSVAFTNGAGNSNENSNVSKRVEMGTPLGSSMVEETEEAVQQATELEGCEEAAVHYECTDEGQGDAVANGDEAVEAEGGVGIDADAPNDRDNKCQEAAEGIADKESCVTGTNTAGVQEIEQEASLVTAEDEAAEVGVVDAADNNAELTTNKDATAEEDSSAQQPGEHSVDGANEEKVMVQAADRAAELIEGAAEKLESPTATNALHDAVDTVIAEMQVSAVAAERIA